MKLKMFSLAMAAVMMFIAVLAPMSAEAAKPTTGPVTIPVTATGVDSAGAPVNFTGTADITRFAVQNGQVVAIGTLTGTATQTVNGVTTTLGTVTNQAFTAPVDRAASAAAANAGCNILHLVLGPLNLNLLGLNVSLNQVVLDITAIPGAGNLLGNLLCAVANLLNGSGLGVLSNLLNQILGILSGL